MSWQTRVRIGLAMFIIAFAAVVYVSMGKRRESVPAVPVERVDPAATLEAISGALQRVSGSEEEFAIHADSQLSYPDGSTRFSGVRIEVRNRGGRDFFITADEARTGPNQQGHELHKSVVVKASDGLELQTEDAIYNQADGIVRAPGAVTFARGRMHGAGVGMSYDQRQDVLSITEKSSVTIDSEDAATAMSFTAGSSVLDRVRDTLTLDGGVHVTRAAEQFDAERATARLSAQEEVVTFIELRGSARVAGGAALESMRARDIDLDYTDDGKTLERLVMLGDAAVALKAAEGQPGREIFGGTLDLELAPDGAITKATGREGVRLVLPAAGDAPGRTIAARTLDGQGAPGQGLTAVQFAEAVDFRETGAGAAGRNAQAQSLKIALDGDAVSEAGFAGRVTFRDQELQARAADIRYAPGGGTLRLAGADAGGRPHVSDDRITIDAGDIDLAFDSRRMTARGAVETTLRPPDGAAAKRTGREPASKLPGLLAPDQAVRISAGTLDYGGPGGRVTYTGGSTLRQGTDTFIRGQQIEIDQAGGNLTATGGVRSSFADEAGASEGTADAIRYTDATRLIVYEAAAPGLARLKGPEGDLKGRTIEISLQADGRGVARLDARTPASIDLGARTVTGAHLHYDAGTGSYVMQGATGRPATFVDRTAGGCKQLSGMKLTFSKSTDNISIDGDQRVRTNLGAATGCTSSSVPAPTR